MPYTGPGDDSLPDYIQKLPEAKRAQWVEIFNSVFAKCEEDDGEDCEALAFKQASGVVMNRQLRFTRNQADVSQVRHETVDGVSYLVAPVVAVREGVMNGEYVSADEIAHHFATWNGRPFVLAHPNDENGESITANDPAVLAKIGIGQLFNVEFIDGLLRGEVWVNLGRAKTLGGDALELVRRLEKGQPVEVSTAYFRDREEQSGEFDGEEYEAVAHNLKPDHLAALLHEKGACSWEDGCGVPRVNQARYEHIDFTPTDAMAEEAQRGLDWRDEHGRGGTEVGIARARDIANKRTLSPETVKRMVSFFSRHEVDKEAEGFNPGEDGYPSNGRIAWGLWGGDAGFAWARARAEQMDAADKEARNVKINVLGRARQPTYDGTEETSWADVDKSFEAYRDSFYRNTAAERPDEPPSRVADAPQAMRDWIAARSLLGDPKAEMWNDLSFFPVVNPGTDKLNAGAVRAVLGGRAAQADIPKAALDSAQAVARALLDKEFRTEEQATNKEWLAGALRTIAQALGLADSSPVENEGSLEDLPRRVRIAWENEHTSNDGMFTGPYVEEVLTDSIIVREEQGLLSIPFSEGDGGDISFGQPTRVEVVYQPISQTEAKNMDELIAQIVEDGRLEVSEDVLAGASEDLLKAIAAMLKSIPREQEAEPETEAEETQPPAEAQPEAGGEPGVVEALTEQLKAQGVLIESLRKQMEAMAANANASERERRGELVNALTVNTNCALSKAQLEALDTDVLESLQRSLVPGDYSGQGGGPVSVNGRQVELRLAPEREVSNV